MAEPTPDHLQAIAEALYRLDAPRYGNDIRPFDQLDHWQKKRFQDYARTAIEKWESFKT